jgi:hypothetical protein
MHLHLREKYRNWKFKNTSYLLLSLAVFALLYGTPFLNDLVGRIGGFGYVSAFFSGIFFVSTFTVAPAAIILYDLADKLNPIMVAIFAGAGAVLGDYIIFKFFKDKIFEELKPLFIKGSFGSFLSHIFLTPYFAWILPLVGAFIIASPLPDEVGLGMMGLSNIKKHHFLLMTFLLNSIGILITVTLARSF